MSPLTSVVGWFDDRLNPIVVKELRQAVQSRFVTVVLMLFLAAQFFVIAGSVMFSEDIQADLSAGQWVFMLLHAVLLGATLLFCTAYTGIRMAVERSSVNVDLLFVTTIRPSSIVWGKFFAGLTLALMIFSACAPFMVVTYLLRGIDVATIAIILGVDLLAITSAVQLALFVGGLPTSIVLKVLMALLLLVMLVYAFFGIMFFAEDILYRGLGYWISTGAFWSSVAAFVGATAAGIGLFFFLSVASVSAPASNRALPARLYVTVMWLAGGVLVCYLAAQLAIIDPMAVWSLLSSLLFLFAMLVSCSERDRLGPRVRSAIPRAVWLRPLAFLFYSGAAGGLIWVSLLAVLTPVIFYVLQPWTYFGSVMYTYWSPADVFNLTIASIAISLYGLAYALTALLVRRYLLMNRPPTIATGPLALGLLALLAAMPPLVAFFLNPMALSQGDEFYLLANPFAVLWNFDTTDPNAGYLTDALTVSAVWAGIALVLNLDWFIRQIVQFRPLRADASAAGETTTSQAAAHG